MGVTKEFGFTRLASMIRTIKTIKRALLGPLKWVFFIKNTKKPLKWASEVEKTLKWTSEVEKQTHHLNFFKIHF